MHRQSGEDAVPDLNGPGKTGSVDEIPNTQPGTRHSAELVNAFQEELCGVIEAAGLTVRPDPGSDRGANWGQLLTAIRDSQLLTSNSLSSNSVTNSKIASSAVTEDKIANSSVSQAKLADDAQIFYASETYSNLSYSGGGGGSAKIPEFTRTVSVGDWIRIRLHVQSGVTPYQFNMYDGIADDGPNPGTAILIPGSRLIRNTINGNETDYIEVLFKSTQGGFSITSGSSGLLAEATLSLEITPVRSDSPG